MQKTIAFLGDSITQGVGATREDNRYSTVLCRKVGAVEQNYGVSGTRIARQIMPTLNCATFDYCFLDRLKVMDKNADFVFIFGGTNDYGHGDAPFGEENSTDEYTFVGALKALIANLLEKYGREKLCFILPLPRFNGRVLNRKTDGGGVALENYRNEIKRAAELNGIDCVDFYGEMPEPIAATGDKFTADGLHPNDYGHLFIAEKLAEYLKNKSC